MKKLLKDILIFLVWILTCALLVGAIYLESKGLMESANSFLWIAIVLILLNSETV